MCSSCEKLGGIRQESISHLVAHSSSDQHFSLLSFLHSPKVLPCISLSACSYNHCTIFKIIAPLLFHHKSLTCNNQLHSPIYIMNMNRVALPIYGTTNTITTYNTGYLTACYVRSIQMSSNNTRNV